MDIQLTNLAIGYDGKALLPPLNATLDDGRLCALLGPNGAGKSTLMRTIAAFQPSVGGSVKVGGKDTAGLTPGELSRRVGVVLTDRIGAIGLTARDVVEMGRSPYTNYWGRLTQADHEAVERAFQLVGIQRLAERQVATLSDGERQKVMIAKALAQETPVIMLDEPTAFLDFPSKVEVMLLLQSLSRRMGKTILLSTHDLDLALQTCDCLWLLSPTAGLTVGTPRELALSGAIGREFPSDHLEFDTNTLRFNIV